MSNTFIWADLSTYDIQLAKRFYSQCFGWTYREVDSGYYSCRAQNGFAGGLFTMPEKFQNMGMPSFWMSYIHVEDIEEIVRVAERHGAKVEVKPQPAPGGGMIALIRDPSGAGFTCYEGEDSFGRDATGTLGNMVWNELHVSDLAIVESFYSNVFGWRIQATDNEDRYEIFAPSENSEPIAGIQVTSNDLKGDKEYWGVYFSVSSLSSTAKDIEKGGGQIVVEQPLGNRPALLAFDSQGAAFYIVEEYHNPQAKNKAAKTRTYRWRAILGLVIVAIAVLSDASWIWGVLFLLWVVPDIRRGSTHFMEHVERRNNPVVYWLIIVTWLTLSIYLLAEWIIGA